MYVLPYGQMSFWGEVFCLICKIKIFNNNCEIINYSLCCFIPIPFSKSKLRSNKRIGPHNYNILEFIFGSLLGDGHAEKRSGSTRITFYQEGSHSAYLKWSHNYVANLDYCSSIRPKFTTRLNKYGKIRTILRFRTYSYTSFNWIQECFYKDYKKILPDCIENYLSPLALAVWIMDDGGKVSSGLHLATNNFTKLEVLRLCQILKSKYNLKANIQSAGDKYKKQFTIYIPKESMQHLTNIVKPYIHSSMKYKISDYIN